MPANERNAARRRRSNSVGDACDVHCRPPLRRRKPVRPANLAGRVAAAHRARLAAGSSAGAGRGRRTLAPAVVSRRADRRVGSCCRGRSPPSFPIQAPVNPISSPPRAARRGQPPRAGPTRVGKKAGAEGPARPKTLTRAPAHLGRRRRRRRHRTGLFPYCFTAVPRMAVRGRLRARKPSRRRCKPSPQARTPCRRRRWKSRRFQPCPCRKRNPTSLPTLPLPLPPARHGCRTETGRAAVGKSGTDNGGGAGQQSLLDNPAAPFAMAASIPAAGRWPGHWIRRRMDDSAGEDITGTLPTPSPQRSSTTPSPAIGDKLPVAIGGPALRDSGARG